MASRELWGTFLLLAAIHSAVVAFRTPLHTDQIRDHSLDKKATAIDLLGDLEDRIAFLLEEKVGRFPPRERSLNSRISRLEEAFVKLFDTSCIFGYQLCLEQGTKSLWPAKVEAAEDRLKRLLDYLVLALAWDCDDLYRGGIHSTGVHYLPRHKKRMYCDMTEVDGAWTVLLRRGPPTNLNFDKRWKSYDLGFGDLNAEFWLGNKYTGSITNLRQNELRITMTDYYGRDYYALYDRFALNTANYILAVGSYQGNATDALGASEDGMKFSTYDKDNDESTSNCASSWTGGWWYRKCYRTHLTGYHVLAPNTTNFDLMQWIRDPTETSQTLLPVRAEMKFRPMHFVSRSSSQKLKDYKPRHSGSLFVPVAEPPLL